MKITLSNKTLLSIAGIAMPFFVKAQEKPAASAEGLAKKLFTPIAGFFSLPLQNKVLGK